MKKMQYVQYGRPDFDDSSYPGPYFIEWRRSYISSMASVYMNSESFGLHLILKLKNWLLIKRLEKELQ